MASGFSPDLDENLSGSHVVALVKVGPTILGHWVRGRTTHVGIIPSLRQDPPQDQGRYMVTIPRAPRYCPRRHQTKLYLLFHFDEGGGRSDIIISEISLLYTD